MIGTARDIIDWLFEQDKKAMFEIKPFKEKRSLKANAYFHRLVGLLASGENAKFFAKKNELILQYGVQEFERERNGDLKIHYLPDNNDYKNHEIYHYFPTPYGGEIKGVKVRAFLLLIGTHKYKSDQMAHLIECTRNECLGCGIPMEEVETWEEKQIMDELRKQADGKKHN